MLTIGDAGTPKSSDAESKSPKKKSVERKAAKGGKGDSDELNESAAEIVSSSKEEDSAPETEPKAKGRGRPKKAAGKAQSPKEVNGGSSKGRYFS